MTLSERLAAFPRRRDRLPPGQRVAALVLVGWSLAMPCGVAILLGGDAALPGAAPRLPLETRTAMARDASDPILEKPLFSRSRRPPSPPPVQAAPPPPAGPVRDRQLALRGVLIRDRDPRAFITSNASPDGTWVGVGDEIGGWQVASIGPRDVQFAGGDERFAATMDPAGGP